MTRLKAPAGMTSCSHAGKVYEVDDGHVDVDSDAVGALASHGLTVAVAEKVEPDPPLPATDGTRKAKK